MSTLFKALIVLAVVLAVGIGLLVWKETYGQKTSDYSSISKEEVEMLIEDIAKINPLALRRLEETPELKKEQLDSLKQLLAFASEAQRTGLANKPINRNELRFIKDEVIAVNYDREMNADKGAMPAFGFITEEQVKAFWGEQESGSRSFLDSVKESIGLGSASNEATFAQFLDTKLTLMKESNPQMQNREISEDEKAQARDFFAKVQIYANEYAQKASSGQLDEKFQKKVNLQVRLQQAQFLTRLYTDKHVDEKSLEVTDEEITKYIAEHPEYQSTEQRTKAEGILNRAKAGEDFAALANEFTEDPGNKGGAEGTDKGGIYENVPLGQMVKPFEEAALALEPGQIAQELVETDFGFHIIKLERKGEAAPAPVEGEAGPNGQGGMTYDVRHILISTNFKDPNDPMEREMPVRRFLKSKLEEEKRKKLIDDLVARNNIQVPEDFDVPQITDEQIKEIMKDQDVDLPGDDGHGHGAPPPPPAKVEPKLAPDAKK